MNILLGAENQTTSNKKEFEDETDLFLNIVDIKPNKKQPRRYFDDDSIKELANSIKEQGLLMPILVKLEKNDSNKKEYKIAYHSACSMQHAQKIHEIPKNLIKKQEIKYLIFLTGIFVVVQLVHIIYSKVKLQSNC